MFAKKNLIIMSILFLTPHIFCYLPPIIIDANSFSDLVQNRLNQFAAGAYSTKPTLYNSFEIAAFCIQNNIPGDFVECGVAAGAQVAAMAFAGQILEAPRTIYLLDSFEGIPLASSDDDSQPGIGAITHNTNVKDLNELLISSGITVHSLESVRRNMQQWGINEYYLKYHKGWFQHVLPVMAHTIDKIAFLRLDGDLYESTKVCLDYLYPKMACGGFVVIDDYALTGCRKAIHEYLEKNNIQVTIKEIIGGQGPAYWCVE